MKGTFWAAWSIRFQVDVGGAAVALLLVPLRLTKQRTTCQGGACLSGMHGKCLPPP